MTAELLCGGRSHDGVGYGVDLTLTPSRAVDGEYNLQFPLTIRPVVCGDGVYLYDPLENMTAAPFVCNGQRLTGYRIRAKDTNSNHSVPVNIICYADVCRHNGYHRPPCKCHDSKDVYVIPEGSNVSMSVSHMVDVDIDIIFFSAPGSELITVVLFPMETRTRWADDRSRHGLSS
jgi:hypothetical protein